jgi:nicotinate-nucleotide adenylyltransferase
MKIGIFGGTFNRIAEEIRDSFKLAKVVFVPAATPPHKPLAENLSFEKRLAMVRMAIAGNPQFTFSDIEGKREGKSYSIDTLHMFRELYPEDEFYFIMGSDSFAEFSTWKEYASIFTCCNIVAIMRPGTAVTSLKDTLPVDIGKEFCYHETEQRLAHKSGYSVYFIVGTQLDISSTSIREMTTEGRSIKYLVPDSVEHYIHEQRIYINAT